MLVAYVELVRGLIQRGAESADPQRLNDLRLNGGA